MEDTKLVETTETSTAAAQQAEGATSQPDLSDLTLEQVEAIFSGKGAEVPVLGGEGKNTTDQVETPTTETAALEPGKPAEGEVEAAATEEVVETRTPEEIEAAQETAIAEAAAAGGDEAAQQAAAEAAAEVKPVNRPRLDEREQLIMGVYQNAKRSGKPITLAEAEARVDGPPAEAKETVTELPPVDLGAAVTALEGEVAGIETKLSEFEEGLYTKEVRDLTTQLADKRMELTLAKRDLQEAGKRAEAAQAEAIQASDANRAAAHAKALVEFPDAADDTTPLGAWISKRVEAIKDKRHPDHALLYADSCPLTLAREGAAELGIAPVRKAGSPPVKPTVEAPPRKVVSPAPGNKTAVVPGQPVEDAKSQLDTALHGEVDLATLDAIQGMPDQSKLLVGANR